MSIAAFLGSVAAFDVVILLILRQWNTGDPWSRLDIFSGGYLILGFVLTIQQSISLHRLSPSPEVRRIFHAQHIDLSWNRRVMILGILELLVFVDYGHLHLTPWLEQDLLQGLGAGFYLTAILWLFRVDAYLSRNFQRHLEAHRFMHDGPYAAMRHPRYTGLLATRIAMPLMMASVIGWVITAAWFWLVRRRIRLEEAYLRQEFGQAYSEYARSTPALYSVSLKRW